MPSNSLPAEAPQSATVAFLEGSAVALLAGAGLAGILRTVTEDAAFASMHVRAGDLLVAAALLGLVAMYASGVHRAQPRAWWGFLLLYAGATAVYVLGAAAAAGGPGRAGRAHLAAALGTAPPSATAVLALHAATGAALLGALWLISSRERTRRDRPALLAGALVAIGATAAASLAFPVFPAPDVPGEIIVRAPWPAAALVPLEEALGIRGALAVAALLLAALAAVPRVDRAARAPWVRPATTAALALAALAFLALLRLGADVGART